MNVIKRKTLQDFWDKHPSAKTQLQAWYAEAKHAKWTRFADIKARFGSADNVPDNRVVFNIGGNKFRLIVKIAYNTGVVYIRFIGTHDEYNKINAKTI